MKINLTREQIIAIQKLLNAHAGIAGINPKGYVCFNAFKNIEEQTGLNSYSDYEKELAGVEE